MPPTRIPNLLHLLLLLAFAGCGLLLSGLLILAFPHALPAASQRVQLLANSLTYLVALGLCFLVFPLLWNRPFLAGVSWNLSAVTPSLLALGLVLGFFTQAASTLLPHVPNLPIDLLFKNSQTIWLLVLFGTTLAPSFEEVVFRGFLLPAIAIAIDWLRLPRNGDVSLTLQTWHSSDFLSPIALTASSVLTSIVFALIHAPQLGHSWPNVAVLAVVSLALCAVRIRLRSVAASILVHSTYNLSIFLTLFIATGGFRHLERVS